MSLLGKVVRVAHANPGPVQEALKPLIEAAVRHGKADKMPDDVLEHFKGKKKAAASVDSVFKLFPAKFRRKSKDGKHEVLWMDGKWEALEDMSQKDLTKIQGIITWKPEGKTDRLASSRYTVANDWPLLEISGKPGQWKVVYYDKHKGKAPEGRTIGEYGWGRIQKLTKAGKPTGKEIEARFLEGNKISVAFKKGQYLSSTYKEVRGKTAGRNSELWKLLENLNAVMNPDPQIRAILDWVKKNAPDEFPIFREAGIATMRAISDAQDRYWYDNRELKAAMERINKGSKAAGRDRTPTYIVKSNGFTNIAWQVKRDGKPDNRSLAKWVSEMNASFEPGGTNEHLRGHRITEASIINQFTDETLATYRGR